MADNAELEKLRKEADDARKARDENWNLYQAEKTARASEVLALNQKVDGLNKSVNALVNDKDILLTELSVLTVKYNELKNNPVGSGALEYITLALKSALAGKWN